MGRPLNNYGPFINEESLFDSYPETQFEKIKIHAFLAEELAPAEWVANRMYLRGDKAEKDGTYYICLSDNTQAVFEQAEQLDAWEADTEYQEDDEVLEDGRAYVCIEAHTSSTDFATDADKWQERQLEIFWASYELGGGALEDAFIIKQVGYNKYLVGAVDEPARHGIVRLVKASEAVEAGLGYIYAVDGEAKNHSIVKLLKDKVLAYVDEANSDEVAMYVYDYNIFEEAGELKASFEPVSESVEVVLETL